MIKKLNFTSLAHKMNFKFLLQVPDSFMCINVNNNNNNNNIRTKGFPQNQNSPINR